MVELFGELKEAFEKTPEKIYYGKHCTDKGYVLDEFALWGILQERKEEGVTLKRFMKFGKIEVGVTYLTNKDFEHYYKEYDAEKEKDEVDMER